MIFLPGNGVKQGVVLSPLLFATYVDPLTEKKLDLTTLAPLAPQALCMLVFSGIACCTYQECHKTIVICQEHLGERNQTVDPSKFHCLSFPHLLAFVIMLAR